MYLLKRRAAVSGLRQPNQTLLTLSSPRNIPSTTSANTNTVSQKVETGTADLSRLDGGNGDTDTIVRLRFNNCYLFYSYLTGNDNNQSECYITSLDVNTLNIIIIYLLDSLLLKLDKEPVVHLHKW